MQTITAFVRNFLENGFVGVRRIKLVTANFIHSKSVRSRFLIITRIGVWLRRVNNTSQHIRCKPLSLINLIKEKFIENINTTLITTVLIFILVLSALYTVYLVTTNNTKVHVNHINACRELEGDQLKAYILGLNHIDKITSKVTFTHSQEVKLLPENK